MAYIALYRNYRPTTFSEVAGQKFIIKTLKNGVVNNKISHAYVFSGQRGIGKTTIARILAKAVNCLEPVNGEPCNHCKNCLSIINNETSDIVEIDAASNNGVDEMRDLLEKVNFLPSSLKKKVYIIDEVHMLSISAFNALLKTLEEPPAHVMFILATTEPHKIPMTILSRCQRFDFKQLNKEDAVEKLKEIADKANILIDDEALDSIAEAAEGGMRDAISILDQVSSYAESVVTAEDVDNVTGKISNYKLTELIKTFNDKDAVNSLKLINELLEVGKEPSRIINNLINYCRDILLYKNSALDNNTINADFKEIADKIDTNTLFYYIDILVDASNKIKYTSSSKLYLEVAVMKIISSSQLEVDFNSKLADIEESLKGKSVKTLSSDTEIKLAEIELKIKKITDDLNRLNLDSFKESTLGKLEMLEELSLNQASLPNDIKNKVEDLENNINQLKTSEYNTQSMYRDLLNKIEKQEPVDVTTESIDKDLKDRVDIIEEYINNLDVNKQENVDNALIERIDNIEKKIEAPQIDNSQDEIMGGLLERMNILEEKISTVSEQRVIYSDQTNSNNDELLEELVLDLENLRKEFNILKENTSNDNVTTKQTSFDVSEYKEEVEMLKENYFTIINSIQKILGDKIYEDDESYDENNNEKQNNDTLNDVIEKINLMKNELEEELGEKILSNKSDILTLNQKYEDLNNAIDLTDVFEKIDNLNNVTIDINEKIEKYENLKLEEKIEDIRKLIEDVKAYNLNLKLKYDDLKTIVESQKQQKEQAEVQQEPIVIQEQVANEKENIIEKEEKPVQKEEQFVKQEPIKVVERIDNTEKIFDIKIVERILHESRTQEARIEKTKIVAEWQRIPNYVGTNPTLEATACLLRDGTLTANGRQELLIVYPDASLCNHLMSTRVHKEACEILRLVYGKGYDFMALPENTWQEKRKEYYSQYAIGISKPVLSPIKNSSLKAIINKEEPKKDNVYERVSSFFGSDKIKKEE